jgi:hypothetical protein
MTDPKDSSSDAPASEENASEEKLGTAHEMLEGWVPALATDADVRDALEKAFDYRGDLTILLKDGGKIEGYVFDRKRKTPALEDCIVRIMPRERCGGAVIQRAGYGGGEELRGVGEEI